MIKFMQLIGALIATLPLKIMQASEDKIITLDEFLQLARSTAKGLGFEEARIARLSDPAASAILSGAERIAAAAADRELTADEVFGILEETVRAAGLGNIKLIGLK